MNTAGTDGTAVVVIAEHLVAPIQLNAAGGVLTAHPHAAAARNGSGVWTTNPNPRDVPSRKLWSSTSCRCASFFEVGRLELSLGDVRQMAPGTVLPLSRPFDEALDIMASGRRIGRGEIVRIGDSLGVRIIRLFDNV